MSLRTFVVAAAAIGGLTLISPLAAEAADRDTAKTLLDELCTERGGDPIWTPYSIARCQSARANKGFDAEREICEGLADGILYVTISTRHMNRASWGCFATSPAG